MLKKLKIAFISDLHLCSWEEWEEKEFHPVETVKKSLKEEKPDVIIDAGDYEKETFWGIPIFRIKGNHDYYGNCWSDDNWLLDTESFNFKGINFGMTTLWGDFMKHNPIVMETYRQCLNDCRAISEFSPEKAYEAHVKQRHWLEQMHKVEPLDVVVTHNGPSFKSIHPRYKRDVDIPNSYNINYGFSSELDDLVESISPKIWVHGHSHDKFDYMIGNTRVICNPCGYPSERGGQEDYKPVYVEL